MATVHLLVAQQFHVHRYTEVDGLPSSQVYSIRQSDDGIIWLATGSGIVSYDGSTWDLKHGSSEGSWTFVAPSSGRSFWSMTEHSPIHIAEVDGEDWDVSTSAPLPSDAAPNHLCVTENQTAFAATQAHGVAAFANKSWKRLTINGEQDYRVLCAASRNNEVLVGTQSGLWRFNAEDLSQPASPISGVPSRDVLGVAYDNDRLWVAQNDWIRVISNRSANGRLVHAIDGASTPVKMAVDEHGRLIVSSWLGIFTLDTTNERNSWGRDQGLIDEQASDILIDHEGNTWIASMRGISKVVADGTINFSSSHGLLADEVSAILQIDQQTYLLGHDSGMTVMTEDQRTPIPFVQATPRKRVLDFEYGTDGRVWIAASDLGLGEMSRQRTITWHSAPGLVQAVTTWGDAIMVGSHDGLWRFDSGKWAKTEREHAVLNLPTRRLVVDSENRLWGCTATHGIWRLSVDGDLRLYRNRNAREADVYAFTIWDNRYLVGTRAGLFEIIGQRLVAVTDFAIDAPVYAFAHHPETNELAIGTNAGVATTNNGALHWITPTDGLLGHEVNRDAMLFTANSKLYVGTNAGLNILNTVASNLNRPAPRLVITKSVTSESDARVYFRVDSYLNEKHTKFRYMLEGKSARWSVPHEYPKREIHFPALPAGEYRLRLIAETPDGRVSAEAISPKLSIRAPFYLRRWFLLTALLVGAALVFGTFINIAQRRYSARLESEVQERTNALALSEDIAQREREQLATTMQSIADGVAAADQNGCIFLWNPAAEKLTGISKQQAIGKDLRKLLGLPSESMPSGSTRICIDNREQDIDSFEAMVAPYGEGKQVVVAFRDIRQLVADERDLAHQQRLESLGLLAGGIAHDFNNYLTVILGTLTMLEHEKALSKDQRTQVQLASATITRAEDLTKQLLTFSTGGAPNRSTVDIRKLLDDAISIALSGSSIVGQVAVSPELLPAHIDHGQISQVFHNLLINARQAMPEGGEVTIRANPLAEGRQGFDAGTWLAIEVEDNGPGMPPDVQRRIFDPFFSRRESTGLGLSVAHSIVTRHGGSISVQSKVGCGTKFEILLPASQDAVEGDQPKPPTVGAKRLRILVMDDEPSVRQLFANMLTHLGHESVTVAEGASAVDYYAAAADDGKPFDLAMFDLTVAGGVGGSDAAKMLLALHPSARLIAVSGYSTDSVLGRYAESGFVDAMAKPFSVQTLQQTIERVTRSTNTSKTTR